MLSVNIIKSPFDGLTYIIKQNDIYNENTNIIGLTKIFDIDCKNISLFHAKKNTNWINHSVSDNFKATLITKGILKLYTDSNDSININKNTIIYYISGTHSGIALTNIEYINIYT